MLQMIPMLCEAMKVSLVSLLLGRCSVVANRRCTINMWMTTDETSSSSYLIQRLIEGHR